MAKLKKSVQKMQKKSKTKKIVKSKKKVPLAFKADRLKSRVLIEALNDDSEIDEYMEKTPQPDIDSVADSNVENSGSESEEELDEEALAEKHKRDLNKLKETDPEFYKFLQVKSLQSFHDFTFFTVTCGPKVWDGHTLSYFFYSICTVLHSNNLTLCCRIMIKSCCNFPFLMMNQRIIKRTLKSPSINQQMILK